MEIPILSPVYNFSYRHQQCTGFSLIEVMVTVVIAGILMSIALPSYQAQVQSSRRGIAKTSLLQLHLLQEAYRFDHQRYATTKDLALPPSEFYTFSVKNVSSSTYILVAKAVGTQSSDKKCAEMSINQAFKRSPAACW